MDAVRNQTEGDGVDASPLKSSAKRSRSNSPSFSSARVMRGGDGVDQALEFDFASMRPPPLIARRPMVIAVVHPKPVTGRVLTAPTGAPRPRRASPPKRPGPPPCCRARFAADSKSHQIDRGMSALKPTTNLTTTTPILPEQRRSAGCFSYPSPPPGFEEQSNERSHQPQRRHVRERLSLDRPEHEARRGSAAADRPRKVHRRRDPFEHGPCRGAAKPPCTRVHQEHRHEPGRGAAGRGAGDDRRAGGRADRPSALLFQPPGRPVLHRDGSGPPRGRGGGRSGRGEPLRRRGRHRPHRGRVRAAARGGRPRGRHHLERRRGAPSGARARTTSRSSAPWPSDLSRTTSPPRIA